MSFDFKTAAVGPVPRLALIALLSLLITSPLQSASNTGSDTRVNTGLNTGSNTTTQPNVIFILTDDLGWGDLGVFHQNHSQHDRRHKTPWLDKMATEGMQLRAHYCPAPVCAPSRCSLLMGVHQGHASIRDNQFDKALIDNHTLATVMKTAGYRTCLIGKYGLQGTGKNANDWEAFPTQRGFDEFFGYVRHVDGHVHYPANDWPLGNSEQHRSAKQVWWNDKEVSKDLANCYTTDLFTARSKAWIQDHVETHPANPFFLLLSYDTPHAALQVPTVAYPKGMGIDQGIQWTGTAGAMINTAVGEIDSYRHPDYVGKGWSDVEERFATMVRRIDNSVGDLMQTLRDLGIAENTLVVFTSDNGPHSESYLSNKNYQPDSFQSYGPYDGIKRDTWEGGIRMPTLAWWHNTVEAGSINSRPSQFQDWMPTLAEAAKIVAPARTDGVSLIPTLTGQPDQSDSTIYVEYNVGGKTPSYADFLKRRRGQKRGQMQVIHLDGFKGVRTGILSHADPFEIYDVNQDPGERKNLTESSKNFQALNQRMQDKVLRLRMANESAKRPYDNQPIPGYLAADVSDKAIVWKAFHDDFPYVPSLKNRAPDDSGVVETLGQALEPLTKSGALEVETWTEIKQTGNYQLSFSCPTKGFVRLHEAAVIDADFNYQAGEQLSSCLRLEKGFHPLRITVLTNEDHKGDFSLKFVPLD